MKRTARALFKSWFVDFDPVRVKADGRDPGLPPHLATLFPDRLAPSELGQIPEGWEVARIGDRVRVAGGSTPRTSEPAFWEGGTIPFATPKDLSHLSGPVLLATERCSTERGLGQIGSGLLAPGTVLVPSRAPIGYIAIAEVAVAVNQGIAALDGSIGRIAPEFLWLWADANVETIKGLGSGTTFAEISKGVFRSLLVAMPSSPVLAAFTSLLKPIRERLRANVEESDTLTAARDTLLPKLISGELRVRDAERFLMERGL